MHLTAMLDRPQANISQHLAILRDAGLVTDEREGMTVIYRVRDERVFDVIGRLAALASAATLKGDPGYAPGWWRHGGGRGRGCGCPRCRGRHAG